jgi:acyl carrier protein
LNVEQQSGRDSFDGIFDRTVAAALGSDEVLPDDLNLNDAGLDSFRLLTLMMALEDEFGGIFPLEQLLNSCRVTVLGQLRRAARDALLGGSR